MDIPGELSVERAPRWVPTAPWPRWSLDSRESSFSFTVFSGVPPVWGESRLACLPLPGRRDDGLG